MFIKLKYFFQIFIFSFFILLIFSIFSNSSFASSSSSVGCYYTPGGIFFKSNDSSSNYVGPIEQIGGDLCGGYAENRLSCYTSPTTCYDVANSAGATVQVFRVNGKLFPSDARSLCTDIQGTLQSYEASCSGSSSGSTGTGSKGSGSGSGAGSSTINVTQTNLGNGKQDITTCSNAGGFLGFFSTKFSCESTKISGNLNCIYNPHKNGLINSVIGETSLQFLHLNDNSSQNSCVPPSSFKSCHDYKTQDNCVSNPAKLSSSCEWISGSNFSSSINKNILPNTRGICLQNDISSKTNGHFKKIAYDKRTGNLFSFKNSEIINGNFVSSKNSFNSNNTFLQLNTGGSISTKISNLASGSTYSYSLDVKYVSGDLNLEKIKIKITQFSKKGILLNSSSKIISLNKFISNSTRDIFKNIDSNSVLISDKTNYINFTISSVSTKIDLALIYFGITSSKNPQNINEIFSFVTSIPSSASSCNICYVKNGLNTCTQKKSNLLGDCSYLVSNVSEDYKSQSKFYFGNYTNPYLNSWSAQSLANSNLFCGLYLTKVSCTNKNNYVNSVFTKLNPHSKQTLCKWSEVHGCFKDSTGNGYPDTRINITKERIPNLESLNFMRNKSGKLEYPNLINTFNSFNFYTYKNSSTFPMSDFQLGCDMSPPVSYIYLTAINSSGNEIYISAGSNLQNENLGDVKIHVSAYNIEPKSCNKFNFKPSIYLSEVYNNIGFYKNFSDTTYINNIIGLNKVPKLKDGQVNVSLILYDQSGNEGKDWNFSLKNVDLSGPNITLTNPRSNKTTHFINNPLLRNSILNFSIKDFSRFNCSFNISPINANLNKLFYNSSNNFFSSSNLKNNIKLINISKYIFNSSSNPNGYAFSISCQDIYRQKTRKDWYFTYTENTNFVLIKPKRFDNKTYLKLNNSNGFLSGNSTFFGISSSLNLKNCSLDFKSLNSNPKLDVVNRINTTVKGYSIPFFKNITGNISFSSNGIKHGNIICYDVYGNKNTQNLTYIYSNAIPILKNFKLINNGLGLNNVVEIKNKFYTTSKNPLANLIFNDNYSFVNKILNLSVSNSSNEIFKYNLMSKLVPHFTFSNITSKNFISNLSLNSFTPDSLVYIGIKNESNLFLKKFTIYFNSISNISSKANFSYFYDNSIPKLNFSTSQVKLNSGGNLLFTTKQNPIFNITFDTPKYRTFSCNVSVISGIPQKLDFSNASFLYFNLSDITGNNLHLNSPVKLDFSCLDIYGNNLNANYKLIFDNITPSLTSVYFDNSNNKFLRNAKNIIFQSLTDKLDFIGLSLSSYPYICRYKLLSNENYTCNSSFTSFTKSTSGLVSSSEFDILKNSSSRNFKCSKTNKLLTNLNLKAKNKQSLNSNINYQAYCTNAFGLNTSIFNGDLHVNYITGKGLFSLTFNVNNGVLYPIVQSFQNYSKIIISTNKNGNNILLTLKDSKFENFGSQTPFYSYISKQGISKNSLTQGNTIFYAIVKDSNGIVSIVSSSNIYIDLMPPSTTITIPDEVGGKVYEKSFLIKMSAIDNKFVKNILLFENGILVLNSSNTSNFNHQHFNAPIFNIGPDSLMNGYVTFKNASINKIYTFKMVAYDKFGNYNSSSITVKIENGIGVILENSQNSFVDPSKISWITKNNLPTINFNTTKIVNYCFIYPMSDSIWNNTNSNYFNVQSNKIYNSRDFSFNLENFKKDGFNLSNVISKLTPIRISCMYNKTIYNYTRYLKLINYLPDYVLNSKNGFIFNQKPFNTILNVKSVGPYRYLKYCNYSIDKITNIFPEKNNVNFSTSLDLSSLKSGIHKLSLVCVDEAGNVGPIKDYNIIINKNPTLIIKNINIINNNGFVSKPDSNLNIYVSSQKDLNLSFESNLKNGITCSYTSNSIGGVFSGFLNFFKNLFNLDRNVISTSVLPYKFTGILNLHSNKNSFDLNCISNLNSSLHFDKKYNIFVLNKSFKLNVSN